MHLEKYYKHGRDGSRREYQVARIYLGHGRRASLHIPKGKTFEDFVSENKECCTDFLKLEKKTGKKRKRIAPEIVTRVYGPIFCDALKSIFKLAGYSVYGSAIKHSKLTYLTPEAVKYRYKILDEDSKALLKSPQELLTLERKAYRLLKRANSKRIPVT